MSEKFEIVEGQAYRKKVRALIINEKSEFLLIRPKHYKSDVWSFVGGGTEANESLEESVIREIREEIGILNIISLTRSNHTNKYLYKQSHQSEYNGQIAYYFVAHINSTEKVTIQNEEIAEYCWVSFDEVHNFVKVKEQFDVFMLVANEFEWNARQKSA